MSDWKFAQHNPEQHLALVHQFSVMKQQDGESIEFRITVKEYVDPPDPTMKFFAESDKMTNQQLCPYQPAGWGPTMLKALSECMRGIEKFPYQGD